MREKVLAEVQDLITAEYEARDALWADAAALAEHYAAKANAQIQARCADLGIPSKHAPGLELCWRRRSGDFVDSKRRAELFKLAEARLAALTETAKTVINANLLRVGSISSWAVWTPMRRGSSWRQCRPWSNSCRR
jgi:hypothetical protein